MSSIQERNTKPLRWLEARVTAYTAAVEETDIDPLITASGERVKEGIVAVSRDIESTLGLCFGDRIIIDGYGVFKVADRTHKRLKKTVDVFHRDKGKAIEFGVKKLRIAKLQEVTWKHCRNRL